MVIKIKVNNMLGGARIPNTDADFIMQMQRNNEQIINLSKQIEQLNTEDGQLQQRRMQIAQTMHNIRRENLSEVDFDNKINNLYKKYSNITEQLDKIKTQRNILTQQKEIIQQQQQPYLQRMALNPRQRSTRNPSPTYADVSDAAITNTPAQLDAGLPVMERSYSDRTY